MRENNLIRFTSKDGEELIILCKSIFRLADLDFMHWGDNQCQGRVSEYCYDVIYNKEFSTLDEYELRELMEEKQFRYSPE